MCMQASTRHDAVCEHDRMQGQATCMMWRVPAWLQVHAGEGTQPHRLLWPAWLDTHTSESAAVPAVLCLRVCRGLYQA